MKPEAFLAGLGGAVRTFAPALPGPWGGIVGGIGAGIALVAELVAAGRDPIREIERIRAIDWRGVDADIDAKLRERGGT